MVKQLVSKDTDPIFLIIAHSIMYDFPFPEQLGLGDSSYFRKYLRNFFAKCLAHSTRSVSIDAPAHDIPIVELNMFLMHYNTDDIDLATTEVLDSANVTEKVLESSSFNRFSGLDLNE